jgi:hypothetical protein
MAANKVNCPVCGESTVPVRRSERLDWSTVDVFWACALCGARLSIEDKTTGGSAEPEPETSPESIDKLAGFLGDDLAEIKHGSAKDLLDDGSEIQFCRDCKHFLKHPFVCRCLFYDRDTEPMKHCSNFERAKNMP